MKMESLIYTLKSPEPSPTFLTLILTKLMKGILHTNILNYNIYNRWGNCRFTVLKIKKELSTVGGCKITHDTLNIKLRDQYIIDQLNVMSESDRLNVGKLTDETVLVDYFSPNVGKNLHMGHIRSLGLGQAISNLLDFSGSKVIRRNHVGDFGLQSGIIMRYIIEYDTRAMEALNPATCNRSFMRELFRYQQIGFSPLEYSYEYNTKNLTLSFPLFAYGLVVDTIDDYYKLAFEKFSSDQEFARRAKIETYLLQNEKSFANPQWENVNHISLVQYNDILDYYYIKGLKNIPESLYKNVTNRLIEELIKEKKVDQNDKEVVYTISKSSKQHNKPDNSDNVEVKKEDKTVLRTREGSLTYMATDLGALSHRIGWNKPDRIIYVTENNQKSHFQKLYTIIYVQLYKIAKKLNILKTCKMEHVGFGQIGLEGTGKIRSRTGNTCTIKDITKQVVELVTEKFVKRGDYLRLKHPIAARKIGVGSILFSDLSVEPKSGYNFSIERLMNQGYNLLIAILYSYVRSKSILERCESLPQIPSNEFRNEYERKLGMLLLGFENMIAASISMREPHRVCKYLTNLSKGFNQFYEKTPVIVDDKVNSLSYKLVKMTSKAIEIGLDILNIQTVKQL
ncbi:arginyl-tRNA synthetase, putative [Theileria annulata]|uniref:arginine--tRNA ligase n=1 Tax=Theileria annulata TaxID=5874 RepID=Q4UIL6_THEAN|nr:arginyl-tRNA synthetase, putative [Theileria annulata]CAI73073.1 arginyl-tRNA synthetase, putative [Theileria annulata]|eukprot:XP_953751.1 arginyl-tRNA synthetase, putative [Theileria annulata]